jgi:hypothetical protein
MTSRAIPHPPQRSSFSLDSMKCQAYDTRLVWNDTSTLCLVWHTYCLQYLCESKPSLRIFFQKCVWPYTFTAPIAMSGSRKCITIVLTVVSLFPLAFCMRCPLPLASRLHCRQASLQVRYHLTCLLHPPCPRSMPRRNTTLPQHTIVRYALGLLLPCHSSAALDSSTTDSS